MECNNVDEAPPDQHEERTDDDQIPKEILGHLRISKRIFDTSQSVEEDTDQNSRTARLRPTRRDPIPFETQVHKGLRLIGPNGTVESELWNGKRDLASRERDHFARLKLIEAVRDNWALYNDKKTKRSVVWTEITKDLGRKGVPVSDDKYAWQKVYTQWRNMQKGYKTFCEKIMTGAKEAYVPAPRHFEALHALLGSTQMDFSMSSSETWDYEHGENNDASALSYDEEGIEQSTSQNGAQHEESEGPGLLVDDSIQRAENELWAGKRDAVSRNRDHAARLKLIEAVRDNWDLYSDKRNKRAVVWQTVVRELRRKGVPLSTSTTAWQKVYTQWRNMIMAYKDYKEKLASGQGIGFTPPPRHYEALHELLESRSASQTSMTVPLQTEVDVSVEELPADEISTSPVHESVPRWIQNETPQPSAKISEVPQEHILTQISATLASVVEFNRAMWARLETRLEESEARERQRHDERMALAREQNELLRGFLVSLNRTESRKRRRQSESSDSD